MSGRPLTTAPSIGNAFDLDKSSRGPGKVIASNEQGTSHAYVDIPAGPPGADGESAYELAVANGFEGDEADWLLFLKGEKGDPGDQGSQGESGEPGSNGDDGSDGVDGQSAYEIAVDAGFVGSETVWLASLKGDTGDQGPQGVKGDTGNTGQQGPQGEPGVDGTNGADGADGDQGPQGEIGPKGDTGDQGETGPQGEQGIQGEKGDPGDQGATGATGATGPNSVTAATATDLTGVLTGDASNVGSLPVSATKTNNAVVKSGVTGLIDDAMLSAAIARVAGWGNGKVIVTDGSGNLIAASGVTAAEVAYLAGVTSAVQTQLNARAALAGATFTGSISAPNMTFSSLLIGGDSTSANTQKSARQVCMHYSASNVYFTTLLASGQASANVVAYGGGTAAAYAATHLRFITAANNTTLTGTPIAEFRLSSVCEFYSPITSTGIIKPGTYTVATLPTTGVAAGSTAYASNGRKSGEGVGSGTGCPVWHDGTNWKTYYDNTTVAA